MEAVNGVAEGPPPPSPLTGCYLLVVLGEPHTGSHKDIILQRLAKGLLSWNVNDCLVDLEKELSIVTEQGLEGEEARYGERLIQYASENLVTEILIHPSVSTLAQCVRNLLSSFTRHRHIIHAGYTFAANGSWSLQDGTFSLADFSEAFQEVDVQRVIHAYENGISIDIHCSAEGEWSKLPKDSFTKGCKLRINPDDVLGSGLPAVTNFVNYIAPFLVPAELEHTLESSDVVGNIRFSRPTLYVFPGGQGDAALFGINGFNMLVDGGFSRKACFWDFVRHLDRLDAVILTRLNNSNANGIGAVLRRKAQNAVYPQIGHFFCNIQSRKANLSPDGDKDSDPLLINLLEEGHELISNLRSLDLHPQLCYRDSEPINLYHKVGHGTLDMYVLNPAKDSREVKEFLLRWNNNDQKLFANHKFSREYMLPLQNIVSICALLVWRPANPNDTITRILFPGSAPQGKVIEGLDKLKNLECIKHTVCTERTLVPSSKLKSKENILDKIVPPEKSKLEAKKKIKPTPENKIIENNMKNGLQNGHTERQVTKASSVESDKSDTKSTKPKREEAKVADNKQEKASAKPKADTNIKTKQKASDKKVSPPTPKKVIDTKKSEIDKESNNQRVRSKISPSATPAKSTKDANNRKVLESKTKSTAKKDIKESKQPEKKEEVKKVERKPISRRPKNEMKLPQSPVKRVVNGVHKPDSLGRKGKLDKEGTTDSSTVSTPSVDQDSLMKKDISKLTPEEVQQLKAQELAELKEEQEAIKELEAVFRKGDKINIEESDLREIKDTSIEDKTEPEEYLIVEKETIEPSPSETEIKEEETVKLARDSEESEKKKDRDEVNDKQVDTEQEESGIGEQETDIEDGDDIRDNAMSKEPSVLSPEENKRFISKEDELKESQPEEKISANVESGATTTAPTLPEDERIPLNEIKEDAGDQIEEKHVREETKEKETKEELPVITFTSKPIDNLGKVPTVVGIRLDKESRIRDIVKTPDEVADLPVHEEADVDHLEEYVHEGTEKTKLKDITLDIDSFVKDETSKDDEKIDKQEHKDEQHEVKSDKIPIHDEVEIESPEKKKETIKDDFESKQTPKESDKIIQELAEHKKPTAEIVAEAQEDQPLHDKAPEKEHKSGDEEKLDVKEMTIQPALDEEQVPKDVKADVKEKKGEIPTEVISPLSEDKLEKEAHVKSEIHEKESKAVEGATHDGDASQIRSQLGKEEVVQSHFKESEDSTKVEQDIISKETVADKEDRIHVKESDKLAQTPKEEEVAEKSQFKETKTSPISSVLEEEEKKLTQSKEEKISEIHDEVESKIRPKEEKHTEQDTSEEKLGKAVEGVKVDGKAIHFVEPSKEKHSPVAIDIKSPKIEKEEIAVEVKDKTEDIPDKTIKDTVITVESVFDEKEIAKTEEKENNLLGELIPSKVGDKKKHIEEVSEEEQDSKIDAKQTSPKKEESIAKIISDEDSSGNKIEHKKDEIKKEVLDVAIDKDDIDRNQQLTHDEELKADISSDETKVEQKLGMKAHVESADDLSKEVELPKDEEVVTEHLEEKVGTYEEQAVETRRDSKTEVVLAEKIDSSGIKPDEELPSETKETVLDKTDSELAPKIVEKADEKPLKIPAEDKQEKPEEKQIKDELAPEKKHEDELLSAKLSTDQETDLLSTKEHTSKLNEKEKDTSIINLKMEDSQIDPSEKKEKSISPEPSTTLKQEEEMKEPTLKEEELEKSVPTTHEPEKKSKDSPEMSHELTESREEKDGLEDKTRIAEKEKSPPKSPEQKEQKVDPLAFEDTKAIALKDDIELKKDSLDIDDIESRIHPEEDQPNEITKHDEEEKSSARQIPEQPTSEMKREEETSSISTHEESRKSPSSSLGHQEIEPSTIKDKETDTHDSHIKKEEELDSEIPYSDQSADQEIKSTLDVKKITPTSDDSPLKIEESPVSIHETIESESLVKATVSPDKSKPDDKEKSPIISSEHSEKEEIEPVTVVTKTIPLTEDSKTIHLTEPGLHVDQYSTKLEEEQSPSSPSNQLTEETIPPKTMEDTKPIHVDDSEEKNKESPKTKTEVISSKSDPEEEKVQEIPESDEMKRSPSPSSEQSADQLSVESKIVSPITELPHEKEDISVIEALASKEDRGEHKTQGVIEHDKGDLAASPEQTLKLSSSEEKEKDETIPIKDEVEMEKTKSSEIISESKDDVGSKISPEHDKKSEKETLPISEKDGDGSITPSPDKPVKEEKHSAETSLEVIDPKIEPLQKESAELLTSDIKKESVSATSDSKVEKLASEKDDLRIIKSKEEKTPQAHIEQYEVEKSLLTSPESTPKKEIESEVSKKIVDKEFIQPTTVLETIDSEKIHDSVESVEESKHEKEKSSSLSIDMLKKDASEETEKEKPDEHPEIDGKITQSLSPVLPIKQEEKHEVESPLPTKEEEDKILTITDALEKDDHSKMSPEKEEKFEEDSKHDEKEKLSSLSSEMPSKQDVETTISKEKLDGTVIPTAEKPSKLEEKAVIKEERSLEHPKPSSSPTEIVAKQEHLKDLKSETEKDSTQPTEDPLEKIYKAITPSLESKSHPEDRKAQEQSKPDEKEKSQTLTEPMESKDLDNKKEEIARAISPTTQDITLVESGDEKSVFLPHENIKDVSDKKIDGESDTKTAEGESKETVTEEPFLPFLSKRASLLEEAEVPTKFSEKEEKIDAKDINLNQEYHLPLKSEDIAKKVVKDETEEIHDSAMKLKEEVEKDIKESPAETTELSKILGNLIRDADPDSVLEESKKDDEVESQILHGMKDQTPTKKLENEKEPLSEAEKVHIEDQVEQVKSKDVDSQIVKEIQLDDIHNFLHQERSHTHREMESSVTDIKTDKKVEDVEKPVTEKPLDELQAKTIEAGIQSVQEFKEDKEETVSSSTDSNKIDIEKDKETKSTLDHGKELKLEAVEHIEDENKLEKGMMEAKEKDEDKEHDRAEMKCESEEPLMKTEKIKIDLTDKPEHAEAVLLKSTPESPVINVIPSLPALPTDIDKMELGRKSPKEREEDVAKIVASVATVLKSDAPLEEFHGKIPLTTNTPYSGYTTELRETHITTCDSPVHDSNILHEEPHQEATDEKMKSPHSLEGKDNEKLDDHGLIRIDESEDSGTVHRMLVTASSEDGGEEIEICPAGTITFSKSSESSGRSSPENISRKPSQSSSALDTMSDHTTVKELIDSQPKKEEIEEHASKTSMEHLQSSGRSEEESETPKLYPELDVKKGIESLEDQIECKVSSSKKQDEPSKMQQPLSGTSKEIPQDMKEIHETVSDKVHSIFGSILSSASKIEETISHAITDTIHSAESTIDEGLKKVETEIDEVKHKITKIESDAVESLSEKKEKAEQLISDRLKESASSLEKVFDETDEEKDSLLQGAQTTLNRISAPLKDTFGDLLSNIADSIKDKDDSLITGEDEKIMKAGEITMDELQKEKEKSIPDEQKETSSTKTEKHTPEPTSTLYPSLESEMKEVGKELDKLTSTQTTEDATKSDASTHEEKILPTFDDVKEKSDDTMKKEEKSEKVPSRESEKTAPIILNGLDNDENVPDETDAKRSADSGSTFKDEKQKHQSPISDDILSASLPEIKSDVDKGTETPQEKIIKEIIEGSQEDKSKVEDSEISSTLDAIKKPSSSPQKSSEAQQISSTLQHDVDSISSSVENMKDSSKDLQKEITKDLEEKEETSVDYTKDSIEGLKEEQEPSILKIEDLVKDSEEKITDSEEKQESVIDKTKDSVKELKEELVEDLKEKHESVVDKTEDLVKDSKEQVVEDLDEEQKSLDHKISDSVKDLEEKIVDLKEKQESVIDKTKESVKDLKEKGVEDSKQTEESVIDKTKRSVEDLKGELVEDLKEKHESVVDKTKDLVKDLKEKVVEDLEKEQKSLVHKISDSVKDLEEKIVDLKEKQESVIDKTKESVKDLKEKVVEDSKQTEESVIDKTKDSMKDLKEELVEDLKEKHESLVDKTDLVKDLKEQVAEDLEEEQKSLVHKISDSVKDSEEKIVDLKEKQESVIDKTKDSVKDLKEELVEDSKDRQESVIDKTKDLVKDLKEQVVEDLEEKQKSSVHKTAELVKELEENIVDLKEKQDSVIDKTKDSMKDLKEKVVEDLKERQEVLTHKTADPVKDLEEKLVDLKEKQETITDETKDSVKDLKEKIVEDLKETHESFVDNTTAIETKTTNELKDLKDSIDSAVHESKEKLESVSTEVASVLQDSKNTITDFSKDVKEVAKLSKENLESSVATIADEAEKTTKSVLSDITSTIGKALPSFGFSQKEEESKHIESQKHSEEELDKDKSTEKKIDVEISEKCDKTKQDTTSVITDISSIVKEEIESSFKGLIEVEEDAKNSISLESSNIIDSLKSVKHTALEAGQTVKEDTEKALEEVKDKSVGLLIEGKEKVLQKTSDFESEIEGTKRAIHEKIEDISKNVKDAKENLEDTLISTKGTIESSLSEVAQDIEKEKDALKSVGKEIQSELKHAVDDVLSSGKQLFSGIFGKKKQDSVEEKSSMMKKEEQHESDSKMKEKAEENKRIGVDNKPTQIHSAHHDSVKDTLSKLSKIETACEETIKEKTGSVPDSCDISKVDPKSCLEVSPSYEKKLSISDVEIIVGEKLKDSSSDLTSKEQISRQDELSTSKPFDTSRTIQLGDDKEIVGDSKDKILDTKTTPDFSTVDKHITDLPTTESSSKEDSIKLFTGDLKADKLSDAPISPILKSPTQIHCEKTMDSDDDSLGSARSMSSQVPLCKNMDPMSMSFYGALPDEEDFLDNDENDGDYESGVSLVHLHDITKAKVDGKLVEGSTSKDEKPSSTDKFPVQDPMTSSFYGELPGGKDEKDPIESWGKPLGLPSPAPPNERGTPKKERRLPSNVMAKNRINDDFARSESPSKNKKKINPVYVDLTYVPHHGNSNYAYVDFFKKVRARYYVFSGIEPSREVYNALLEAKQTWEDKDLEVTIIPTYDTDVLGYWVAENEELLAKYKIDLSPSASRCTINLQDHETSCSAYRLEF